MSNPKFWDEYEIKARYIPCFVTAIPVAHFLIQLLGVSFWETIARNIGWMLVTNLSLSLVVTIALMQLQCGIAKYWIENSVFGNGGINFPTTNLLLFKNNLLSRNMKLAIREKIKNDFHFELIDEAQEGMNTEESKRLIKDAVGFIRAYVGKGRMIHQYNIGYGFIRNLIGGSLWACSGCIGSAITYGLKRNWEPMSLFSLGALIFATLLIFKGRILSKFAEQYAETLFTEYLTMKGVTK